MYRVTLDLVDGRRYVRLIYAANSGDACEAAMRGRCYIRDVALVTVDAVTIQIGDIAKRYYL
jgi:hypothetical protein